MPFVPRKLFPKHTVPLANFHGHHRKALEAIHRIAPQVDLVLELRDSRAPLTSINGLFDRVLGHKEKLIIYTKNDLSCLDRKLLDKWHRSNDSVNDTNSKYLVADCRNAETAQSVLKYAKNLYTQMHPPPPLGIRMLITGMPNVGKSTFLNSLRKVGGLGKRKVAQTGELPGVTRSVSETVKISEDPPVYLFDTPGVFVPQVKDSEDMIKLCLINAVKRSHIDPMVLADYLLYRINQQYPDGKPYSKYTNGQPTNNIEALIKSMARFRYAKKIAGAVSKETKKPAKKFFFDENAQALQWIDKWTKGKVAKVVLDDIADPEAYQNTLIEQKKRLENFDLTFKPSHKKRIFLG